jgi:alpha-galactosidase
MNRQILKAMRDGLPLRNVQAARFQRCESGEGWWRLLARGRVAAEVTAPGDAFLCRLDCPGGEQVVQLSVGRVRSTLADSLYSPGENLGIKLSGGKLRLEWDARDGCYRVSCRGRLDVAVRRDFLRRGRGIKWYRPLSSWSASERPPAGWCSWYIYAKSVDEAAVVRNLRWLSEHLAPYGLRVVQVDDGWQGKGWGHGGDRDWYATCLAKFPHGMKWLAERIRSEGMTPGIWVIPFTQSDEKLFAQRPELFVRDEAGRSVNELDKPLAHDYIPAEERRFRWSGRYLLDPTAPAATRYMEDLFRVICDEWGYEYVKVDAQGYMVGTYTAQRQRLADAGVEPAEAYRRGLEAVRRGMGERRFLLNCTEGWDGLGLCDGIRTGGDVRADVSGIEAAVDVTMRWLFINGLAAWTDPDVLCVRPPLSLEQARTWATLVGLTGQMLMTSDDMPRLGEDRVELLRRVLPACAIRPMELYPVPGRPRVIVLKVNKPGVGEWSVAAAFNWSRSWTSSGELTAGMLGMLPARGGFVWFDVWRQKLLSPAGQSLRLRLGPMSCRVVCVREAVDRPQVIGTGRHVAQGVEELDAVAWDARRRVLRGRCRGVKGAAYKVWFNVPDGWRAARGAATVRGAAGSVTIGGEGGAVEWAVGFAKARGAGARK